MFNVNIRRPLVFRCLVQQSMWGNMGVVVCNALLKNGILHVRAFILKQYKHLHYTEKKEIIFKKVPPALLNCVILPQPVLETTKGVRKTGYSNVAHRFGAFSTVSNVVYAYRH